MKRDEPEFDRREFLSKTGAGLFVFFPVSPLPGQEPERLPAPGRMGYPTDFNAYLKIGADGRVSGFAGKVELGQGSTTSLAQIIAEELDVSLDSIDMTMGDTEVCPWDIGTFGSLNIWQFGPVLHRAAAEARAVLLQTAAERLQSHTERLRVANGVISDSQAPEKRVTYAQLVQGRRIERYLENAPQKAVAAYSVIGQSPRRKDSLDKVTGKAKYAGDIILPGVLHARILRPPSHGATLKTVDTGAAGNVAGVRVVKLDGLVAVLHERRDIADKALGMVKAEFSPPPPGPDDQTIFEHMLRIAPQPQVVAAAGRLAEGELASARIVEQIYLNSYVAHAAIETHSATASVENGKATVWASTQAPFTVRTAVAQALGFPPQSVRVVAGYVGAGFGGKTTAPQGVEAALLAKATGRPVQVVWDRAEEFFYDGFRPAAVVKIRSGLTAMGKISFWDYAVTGAGGRNAGHFYDIPHHRTTSAGEWGGGNPPGMHPFAVGPWRAPSVNSNTFARESHIDLLANAAGMDPLEFRLKNLSDKRMIRVLRAAAEKFGWTPGKTPSGRGFGVSCAIYAGTYAAMFAEVAVNKATGEVRVKRVVLAQDLGVTVSPDGSRQQMEGSITMGLGYALSEEIRFKGGDIVDRSFGSYYLPRFSWLPQIETILIDNPELPAQGCGEPPIVTVGAVIANAIHDAIGVRLTRLPMTPVRVLAALRKP